MEKPFSMFQALQEASRCLLCHEAPCSAACPASTEPGRFIRKLRFRNFKGAVAVVKRNNVFGGVCSVVCPTHSLCEQGCLASGITTPIQIGKIQHFLVEYGWQIGFNPVPGVPSRGRMVGIVGAGPSGLACAGELAKWGYHPVVFEKLPRAGGMLRYVIPEGRLTSDLVEREIAEIVNLGVEIRLQTPVETQRDLDRLFKEGCEAVYVATGAWRCTEMGISRAGSGDVYDAMSFLRLAKEGPQEFARKAKGKYVAVVGGGDSAMDSAVTAKEHGARDVFVIYRRSYLDMPASEEAKERALKAGIHFVTMTQPVGYIIEGRLVKGIKVASCELCEPDESKRRRPVIIKGSERDFRADLVVEALGLVPDSSIRQFSELEFDALDRVVTEDDSGTTSVSRILAGGDAVRGSSLVAKAVGDGKKAAVRIRDMLEGRADGARDRKSDER